MAEQTQFVLGVLGADFETLKTSDGIYLSELLKNEVELSLAEFNNRELALSKLLCRKYDDATSQEKRTLTHDSFDELGEMQTPAMHTQFDVWNYPVPIRRFGSLTMMTRERVQLMSSSQFLAFHNAKLEADLERVTKEIFRSALMKTPNPRVDALDGKATTAKSFWNNDAADVPESNGQLTFASSHLHFNIQATIGTAGVNLQTYLLDHLMEHKWMSGGQIVLWVQSGATAGLIKAETVNFRAVQQASEILGLLDPKYIDTGRAQAIITGAKFLGYNVKVVGTWKESIVIETPDMPANYILGTVFISENNKRSPLAWREHPQFKGLSLQDPNGSNPLIGKNSQYRRYLGLGVNERSAGAVLFLDAGGVWVEPTLA